MSKVLRSYRLDEKTLQLIEELKDSLNLSNNSDVLRRAITLLKLASDNQNFGGSICLKSKDSEREIIL